MRSRRGVFLAISCLLGAAAASADELVLTPAGMEKIEEIKRAIAPAPLLTNAAGQPYIRCIVVDAAPGDPSLPWTEPEGKPSYVLFAFGEEGRDVGPRVQLSSHLVEFGKLDVDSMMDLRTYGSNRDRLWRTPIGSRRYVAGIFRALDPDGSLGLRLDLELPPDGEDLEEGTFVDGLIEHPPMPGEPGYETSSSAVEQRRVAKRLPPATKFLNWVSLNPWYILKSIAQARKYSIFDGGFEEAGIRILAARTELARIDPERVPAARKMYAGHLRDEGHMAIYKLVSYVHFATPGIAQPGETGFSPVGEPGFGPVSSPVSSHLVQPALPVDPSDLADVAMDVLRASDAVFFAGPYRLTLVQVLTGLGREPQGADPRADDEIDPRPKGKQLLLYLMGPPPSRDPQVQAARQQSAAVFKQYVQDELLRDARFSVDNPGKQRFCLDALALSGWVASEETLLDTSVTCGFGLAGGDAIRRMNDESTTPEERAEAHARFRRHVQLMRDLAALTTVGREDERKIGQVVLDYMEKLRSGEAYTSPREAALILDAWRQLGEE